MRCILSRVEYLEGESISRVRPFAFVFSLELFLKRRPLDGRSTVAAAFHFPSSSSPSSFSCWRRKFWSSSPVGVAVVDGRRGFVFATAAHCSNSSPSSSLPSYQSDNSRCILISSSSSSTSHSVISLHIEEEEEEREKEKRKKDVAFAIKPPFPHFRTPKSTVELSA